MADGQADSRGEARQSFFAKQQLIDSARTTFQLLAAVMRNAALYPESHPIMITSADKLRTRLAELLVGRKEAAFFMAGGELFFEKLSIPLDQSLAQLIEHFAVREVGGVAFKPGIGREDLVRFSVLMNKDVALFSGKGDINAEIRKAAINHIELHRVLLVDRDTGSAVKAGKQKAAEIFKQGIETLKDMAQAVQLDKTVNMRRMNTIVQTLVDNVLDDRDAFLGLTNIKMYDEYTFAHSVNVSILAVSLGTYLSLEKPQIAALGVAGLMHDIGKIHVSREIINKPGKLTPDEWEEVKRHPVEGALILAGIRGVSKLAMVAAFEHHQHGPAGYPGKDGERRQHHFSQIISLADAYEAITAARVYYSAQTPPDEAIRILLKKRGAFFNPYLVNTLIKMIGIFPIGSVVKLDSGEIGLVRHQTSDLMRPRVLILTVFDGSETESGAMVSLLETEQGRYRRSIAGTINPNSIHLDVKKYLA